MTEEEHVRGRLPDPRASPASVARKPSPSLAARIKMLEADAEKRNLRLSPSPSPHRSRSRARAGSMSGASEVSSAIEIPTCIPTVNTNGATCLPLGLVKELPPTPVDEEVLEDQRAEAGSAEPANGVPPTADEPAPPAADTSTAPQHEPSANNPYAGWGTLQRRGSVFSLSRISFAAQLSRLTSLSLPISQELSDKIRHLATTREMGEALMGAGRQIGRWIDTAKKVLRNLDAEDDVEWAAQGKESLSDVDEAVTKFSGLINVYVGLIDELQLRPDSDTVESSTLVDIVTCMEETVDGWKSVQDLLKGVKDQVETAMEWSELWTTILQDIQAELDACQTLLFELEERRHRSLVEENGGSVDIDTLETIMEENSGSSLFPLTAGKPNVDIEDSSLLGLFARMQPLRASLDFLPMRIQSFQMRAEVIFPSACEDLESRRNLLEKKWKRLNADAESLKKELGEDRWVAIFRNAGKQASAMLDSIERSMNKLREAVVVWDESGGRNDKDLRKKMESYEAKKMHYGAAIERTLGIITKGIGDRFTVNGEIIRLDAAVRNRWKSLQGQIAEVDQTLNDLQLDSQTLRDSISTLTSLDIGSALNTPGSSPASSVVLSSPGSHNRKLSPAASARRAPGITSRQAAPSGIPKLSPYNNRRLSASPVPPSQKAFAALPASMMRAVSSPSSLQQATKPNGFVNRPRWNSSTKTDDKSFGHNFKPLSLTSPSPYRKTTPPTTSSRRSSNASTTSSRIPLPSPLGKSPTSPSLRPPLATPQRTVGQLAQSPTPGPRLSLPARPELRSQHSTSRLRESYTVQQDRERPKVSARPASALAHGRRSSMLPRPPSGIGNRSSMPPSGSAKDGRPRWRH